MQSRRAYTAAAADRGETEREMWWMPDAFSYDEITGHKSFVAGKGWLVVLTMFGIERALLVAGRDIDNADCSISTRRRGPIGGAPPICSRASLAKDSE